jgi:hypothetical protein
MRELTKILLEELNMAEEKTKGQIRREKKKEALNKIVAFVLDNLDQDEPENKELIESALLVKPGRRGGTTVARKDVVRSYFNDTVGEGETVHEDQIWSDLKLGRAEMRKATVNLIKKATDPEDRMWIEFDPETGVYDFLATGPEPPSGWTGYRPVEVEDIDLD